MKNSQTGFTLIAVLILSSLASLLVLNSLRDNVIQERLSGNFQKKVNARLSSEKGVYDSINALKAALALNPTANTEQLVNLVGANNNSANNSHSTKYQVSLTGSGDTLDITSKGQRYSDAIARLNIRLRLDGQSGSSSFSSAVVGCEGVNLSGSGQIDSYDASVAPYDENTPGDAANVSTINANSDVILGGHSPIYGDVSSTGKINLNGSSPVFGNLHASSDITLGQSQVKGNIFTGGNYRQAGGNVEGYVRANGFASLAWGAHIDNVNYASENNPDIQYGISNANSYFPANYHQDHNGVHYSDASFHVHPNVPNVVEHDPDSSDIHNADTNCDNLAISGKISALNPSSTLFPELRVESNIDYSLTTADGSYTVRNGSVNTSTELTPTANVSFLNAVNKPLYKLSSFFLGGDGTVEVSGGDILLYVSGDFTIAGDTTFTIAAGSSLTLITEGKVKLINGAKIDVKQHGLTTSGLPAMSIYSSYNQPDGVILSGDFRVYAAIYAPLTDFSVSNSGELFGSVRAKTIAVPGNARIHYDASLSNSTENPAGSGPKKWLLDSWQY